MSEFFDVKKDDVVNSPAHYTKGQFETIDVILDTTKHLSGNEGYLLGNVIKYLSRYHFKNGQEDLEKARWYLNRFLDLIREEKENA